MNVSRSGAHWPAPVVLVASAVLGLSRRMGLLLARKASRWELVVDRCLEVPHLRWEDVAPVEQHDAGDEGNAAGIEEGEEDRGPHHQ